ncbi:right-handed parallel beta-helix repeat-containing protein (plasmid) [Haloferax sp. S1W]|uniref:right-handed parallel beta-helix repeat-containing protein n=1 Tax=Haloferax sp. S1W TaxID=3377110 RepID=UPI0037C7C788
MTGKWTRRALVAIVVVSLVTSLVSPGAVAETNTDTTFVESDITTDATWTPDGGPYRIIQDIHIAPGATLTIQPGTDIQLAEQITLSVDGSLYANGTDDRPVTISRTDGAAPDRRWASIRYNGTDTSRLVVHNTTLEGGTSGITVDSSDGTIRVVDSTLQDFSTAGLSVDDTTATPSVTIKRSAFRIIDGHAIRASPSMGATGDVSLTASPNGRENRSNHMLSLDAGVGVAFDTVELQYSSAGTVRSVDAQSIERIGLDRNRNGSIERSFFPHVSDVSSTDNRLEISLSKPVRIPSDGRLLVEYKDAVNPATRGIYPVTVDLRKETVSQLSDGVQGSFVVGNITSPVDRNTAADTRVQHVTVRDSTFSQINGSGVFAAADTVRRFWLVNNRISRTDGSGITIRAARSETNFWHNEISAGDAGIQIDARTQASMTASGNQIHDAQTGIRVHQSGAQLTGSGELTLRENTVADNVGHGVGVTAHNTELSFQIANNTIRDNGRDGVHIANWLTRRSTVQGNQIENNGGDGFALDGTGVRKLTLAHNDVEDNAGTGLAIQTQATARRVAVHNNTVKDGGGHGVTVRSEMIVHQTTVRDNRLANNAGAGLLVASPITHRGNLSVAHNTIAANSYGIIVRGVIETTVQENDVVFNTNAFADPVPVSNVNTGTGVYIAEGASGAIVNQAQTTIPLEELVANPTLTQELTIARLWDETVVVLRTDGPSQTRSAEASALQIRQVSGSLPTGIGIQKAGEGSQNHRIVNNSIYGHRRGLTVDIEPLISANTTARIVVDPLRTVEAESNYWGAASGPYHSSILPAGDGNPVVTERGWVDFTPFRTEAQRPLHARPTARIEAPATAAATSQLKLSGATSESNQSPVARYHFVVNGTAQPVQSSPDLKVTMPDQPLEVGLAVENRLGIDSATTTTTIDAAAPTATPASTTTVATTTASATQQNESSTPSSGGLFGVGAIFSGGLSASLGSLWGLLGSALYLGALVLGGHGMVLTVQNRSPPVSGLRIQGLAVAAVLVWLAGGVLGSGPLIGVGLTAAVSWGGLTAIAYVLATRG